MIQIDRTIKGLQFVELQPNGGGNFLTQNFATYFPTFHSSILLRPGQSADSWREVTAAERSALEAKAATWERPPQSFIDQWNAAARTNGCYNEATGFFELNGLTDIPYSEAMLIYQHRCDSGHHLTGKFHFARNGWCAIRTNLVTYHTEILTANYTLAAICCNNQYMEVLHLSNNTSQGITTNNTTDLARGASSLRKITPTIYDNGITSNGSYDIGHWGRAFWGCKALEEVRIRNLGVNIDFKDCPKLSYESVRYILDNSKVTTAAKTFKVHADVYAKITGDTSNAAAAALSAEELALWMALPEIAETKNTMIVSA